MTNLMIQFEEDKNTFEHLVIDDIKYWDSENEKIVPARLELFGHSLELLNKTTLETVMTSFFNQEMAASISIDQKSNTHTVTLMEDPDLMFLMSKQQFNLITEYFNKINSYNLVSYSEKVNEVLANLFEHIEDLLDLTIRFIEEQPSGFFTTFENILMLECYIQNVKPDMYSKLLLSSETTRQRFTANHQSYIKSNTSDIASFFANEFKFFQKLLGEKSQDVDILIAYLFLFNIVLQRNAIKWDEEHGKDLKVEDENLTSLIERFFAIEDIDPYDVEKQGSFFYYLYRHGKFDENNKLLDNMNIYHDLLQQQTEKIKFNNFKNRLKMETQTKRYSIDDIDLMDGQEFENFLATIFTKMGYKAEVTKASRDQGIDIIAAKDEKKIGVQAKCYAGMVGNSAVQEAVAGKAFYKLDKVMVITNNYFTDSAMQLAKANGVILWDRNLLKEKISEVLI